jgi:hypothetical protein
LLYIGLVRIAKAIITLIKNVAHFFQHFLYPTTPKTKEKSFSRHLTLSMIIHAFDVGVCANIQLIVLLLRESPFVDSIIITGAWVEVVVVDTKAVSI